jgi:hypothetical protein
MALDRGALLWRAPDAIANVMIVFQPQNPPSRDGAAIQAKRDELIEKAALAAEQATVEASRWDLNPEPNRPSIYPATAPRYIRYRRATRHRIQASLAPPVTGCGLLKKI